MEDQSPHLISIIIPVYNAEPFLEACLESVTSQDHADFEIIAVDDGSTDRSLSILQALAETDTRIAVLQQENSGPSIARNRALSLAKGEFVFFLDADDTLFPGALASLIADFERTGADLMIGQFRKVDPSGSTIRGFEPCPAGILNLPGLVNLALSYLREPNRYLTFAYAWGRLFKTAIIKNHQLAFNEAIRSYEDVTFNFDYLAHCTSACMSEAQVYQFLVRNDHSSLTFEIGNDPARLLGYNQAISRIKAYITEKSPKTDTTRDAATALVSLSIIQSIRICVNLNVGNFGTIYRTLRQLVNDNQLQESLNHYEVRQGHSSLIPFLMKYRLVLPLVVVCTKRGWQRYGKKK